jgi:uncharacterized protein YkwD
MLQTGHISRVAVSVFLALVVPMVMAWQPARAANAGALPPEDPALGNLISAERTLLDLTNADRVANGLAPLDLDVDSLAIARERAEDQLDVPSLSHYDANGELVFTQLLAGAQLGYRLAGENLARASVQDATVIQRVEQALMQSPAHRRNILEPTFKRVAIGAATDPSGQITFAEVYRD